jgi:CBS-domain-containing membrane protein
MNEIEHKARHTTNLQPGVTFKRPPPPADFVRATDPALEVFTDFEHVVPRTVSTEKPIDEALEQMKEQGVRLLLVTDADCVILGVVTAVCIQGEKPIRLIEERRVPRRDIRVRDVMIPQSQTPVLNMVSVESATVGHILATLRQLQRQHVLVVEVDDASNRQIVRGLFSTSQINRQMHAVHEDRLPPAESLADLVGTLGSRAV